MNLSDTQILVFVRGESFHIMWNAMWRKHGQACKEMHAETQKGQKQELADKADKIWEAIDHAERVYDSN
jgi:hypothetical protein